MLCVDVDGFWISGGMAERLHNQIGGKTQAGKVFKLVAGHRPGSVLRPYGSHFRFAVSAGTHALQTTCLANHFLRQGITFI